MRTSILKTRKLKIWVSGSRKEPYTHIYFDSKKTECGYKALNIFPYWYKQCIFGADGIERTETRRGVGNRLPKYLQKLMQFHYDWKNWDANFFGDDVIEIGGKLVKDPNWKQPVRPSFLSYIISRIHGEIKMKNCKHPNMGHFDSISPESGSESFYCPDCGYSHDICYY